MNHLAAAILLSLGGKEINETNLKEVLGAAGATIKDNVIANVVKHCKGKDALTLAKEGLSKLGSVSAASVKTEEKKEDKKAKVEPKKEEKVEEEEAGGFGDLFG